MKSLKILTLIFVFIISACSSGRILNEALSSFKNNHYHLASEKLLDANKKIKDKSKKPEIYFKLGECYRNLGEYSKSAMWYRNAVKAGYSEKPIQLIYADVLRANDKPSEAKLIYDTELQKDPKNKQTINGIESVKKIREWKEINELYIVESLKQINSKEHDIVVLIKPENENIIYFKSSRVDIAEKEINPVNGQKYSGIFATEIDDSKNKWKNPGLLTNPDFINTIDEDESIFIDSKSELLFFSNSKKHKTQKQVSKIYFSVKNADTWNKPNIIPFSNDGYNYKQPMISDDGKTLWFSSDRPGGYGLFDIWFSVILLSGEFLEPVNAGPEINTQGNEMYPFQKPNGQLYFSSDFHPGIGGFDIFKAQRINSSNWTIDQLPPPINSPSDDISIQFYGNTEKGFFSSNRKPISGFDIYSFYLPQSLFQCFGKIFDSETDSLMPDVNLRISGSDGSSQKIRTSKGKFTASLNPDNDYSIVVYANGYLNAQAIISTRGLKQAKDFEVTIKSVPINKPIRIENINYDLGKWDLSKESKMSLKDLIELLKINPQAIIEISAHTDDTGDENFNLELSEKRAQTVLKYMTEMGVNPNNLKAKGYGETTPYIVSKKMSLKYNFLNEKMILNSQTIESLGSENLKNLARGLNRRTEFKVINAGNSSVY